MLRKATFAIAGTLMLSGLAAAAPFAVQPASTFPLSITDSNPSYRESDAARAPVAATAATAPWREVQTPDSVSDSMPEMVGGRSHPTMEGHGATFSTRESVLGGVRGTVRGPVSVDDNNPSRSR